MSVVRAHLAVACAAIATAVPFVAAANASGTGHTASPTTVVVSRQSRTSGVGVAGGSAYLWSSHRNDHHGGACTIAFAVRSKNTGRTGVLTAGHCVETLPGGPTYELHQTRNVGTTATDPGVLLARIGSGHYRMGTYGDSAFGGLAAHRRALPLVFIGGSRSATTIPVAGLGRLVSGERICYSGAASGEHCGFTVGGPRTVMFKEGGRTIHIQHEWTASGRNGSCTSVKGDSGSPVYVKRNGEAFAVGILSGGQDAKGTCPFFFTPVSLALRQYDLALLRS